jgi:hypothetical protein
MTATAATHLLTLPAVSTATAWLNAFLATGHNEERPALCRTLSLEFFDFGLQLIGCDGTILFRSWVVEDGHDGAQWPDIAEVMQRSATVMDPDGFGVAFMRTLLTAANASEHPELVQVSFDLEHGEIDDTPPLGNEFLPKFLVLRAQGQRLDLRLYEGQFPEWRKLKFGLDDAERVDGMKIALRMFKAVAKLKGVFALDLEFHGTDRQIVFRGYGDCAVEGLIMPMRRDEERKPKKVEPEAVDEEEGEP